jgi:hypothetical protein
MKAVQSIIIFSALTISGAGICRADQLFANGSFEAGVTGFTSDYAYNGVSNSLEGQFAVVSSPNIVHPSWGVYGDHTTGTGLMQTANGSTAAGLAIWRQTVDVVPGADYTFSAWAASSFMSNPAALSFRANDVEFLALQLTSSVGAWTQATTVVNAGASSSIEFEIVDSATFGNGNDFTLDDISLDGPKPIPEPASLATALLASAMLAAGRCAKSRRAPPTKKC